MLTLRLLLLSTILLLGSASKILDLETAATQDFERAQKLYQIHEAGAAKSALKRVIETYPKTESARNAELLLKEIEAPKEEIKIVKPEAVVIVEVKEKLDAVIGLILPLTGAASGYGERTLAAVQMALSLPNAKPSTNPIWIQKKEGLTLVVADSKGDAKTADSLVDMLVNTHKVVAILGDILTDSASAVAKKSQAIGVTNLSLSRQDNITKTGDWIFRLGMTTHKQTQAIAKQISAKKITVLYPENSFGKDMNKSLSIKHSAIPYKADETTFTKIVEKVPSDVEVIFIPDFPKTVSYIVPALISKGLLVSKSIQLVGPGSWNGPLLGQRLGKQINGAWFVDGIDWSADNVVAFSTEFKQRKTSEPSIVEAQAYDAASIMNSILALAKTRDEFRQKLKDLKKWPGLTGSIGFDDNRDSNTLLWCFEFENGQSKLRNDKP